MEVQPKRPTAKGPADRFAGDVWIDTLVEQGEQSSLNILLVHFTPGAHTAWHSHDGGQTLYVMEGRGLVQARGEGIVELRAGDVHLTPDGQEHWHGARHDHFMSHITVTHNPATWGEHVTDAEYRQGS
jgi:quercetin dioxygenase-like cupin family protein